METKYKIGDRLMPTQAKGQALFPVFEVIAIKEFNMGLCYICFVQQCFNGALQDQKQIVPLAVNQEDISLYSLDGEYTSTINADNN